MKRGHLIRHLIAHGCTLAREGKKHTIYVDTTGKKTAPVPRHEEIDGILATEICKELGIPRLAGR